MLFRKFDIHKNDKILIFKHIILFNITKEIQLIKLQQQQYEHHNNNM